MSDEMVLVTGSLGWLGFNLTKALLYGLEDERVFTIPFKNYKVRCLVMPDQDDELLRELSDSIEIVKGDLRNPDDCSRFCNGADGSIIFHTAGIIHPARVSDFFKINVEGTKNLLDAAINTGVKRAVVVSSNSPCGCNPHPDHLFDEESPYRPYMNYGRSKMMMEILVNEIHRTGRIGTVIIRSPWFYGPNQPPRQTLFFRMIRDGKAPIVGGGNNLRSMTYIDNLCQGLLLSAYKKEADGETYWIADERPYSMNEIIETVERLLETEFGQKCSHKRTRLPNLASETAFYTDAFIQRIGFYNQKIHVLSEMNKTIACSINKTRLELGYNPEVGLEEGMRRSIRWLFEQRGGL